MGVPCDIALVCSWNSHLSIQLILLSPPSGHASMKLELTCLCLRFHIHYSTGYAGVDYDHRRKGKDTDLVIQIKQLSSFASWFRQYTAPPATKWFDHTKYSFRSWRTQPAMPFATAPAPAPAAATLPTINSAINYFLKEAERSISDYKPFKEDC